MISTTFVLCLPPVQWPVLDSVLFLSLVFSLSCLLRPILSSVCHVSHVKSMEPPVSLPSSLRMNCNFTLLNPSSVMFYSSSKVVLLHRSAASLCLVTFVSLNCFSNE